MRGHRSRGPSASLFLWSVWPRVVLRDAAPLSLPVPHREEDGRRRGVSEEEQSGRREDGEKREKGEVGRKRGDKKGWRKVRRENG